MVEFPFSHFGFSESVAVSNFETSNTAIGNIYVGGKLNYTNDNSEEQLLIELDLRVPTTPEPSNDQVAAQASGLRSEMSDRLEAFMLHIWALPVIVNLHTKINNELAVKLRLGNIWDIYEDSENSVSLLYGVSGFYQPSDIEIFAGINGRSPYIGNNPSFFKDGFSQIRGGLSYNFGNIVPGFYIKKAIGENYNLLVDWGYGLNIEYQF